jgi:hypothetical protein
VWPSAGFIRPQMPSNEPALDESLQSVSQSREKPHQSISPGQTMTPSAADEAAADRNETKSKPSISHKTPTEDKNENHDLRCEIGQTARPMRRWESGICVRGRFKHYP